MSNVLRFFQTTRRGATHLAKSSPAEPLKITNEPSPLNSDINTQTYTPQTKKTSHKNSTKAIARFLGAKPFAEKEYEIKSKGAIAKFLGYKAPKL